MNAEIAICLLCPNPAQERSCFCLACDNGNVGGIAAAPLRAKRTRCGVHEAMVGRRVCEECAD